MAISSDTAGIMLAVHLTVFLIGTHQSDKFDHNNLPVTRDCFCDVNAMTWRGLPDLLLCTGIVQVKFNTQK